MNGPCNKCYHCFYSDKYNNVHCNYEDKLIPAPQFCANQVLIGHAESAHSEECNLLINKKEEWNKKAT